MYMKSSLVASALALCASAAPLPDCPDSAITAEQLISISAKTASCASAAFPTECANATVAADAINKSFATYQVTAPGEQAALIAYMLFESGDFQFKTNHFPGRPGQGTRMMAMPPFVKEYATAIISADAVATAEAFGGDAGLNATLALVNSDDEKSFGAAPWFLTSKCTPEVRTGLVAHTIDGWHAFLTECVGTTAAPERDPLWITATKGLSTKA